VTVTRRSSGARLIVLGTTFKGFPSHAREDVTLADISADTTQERLIEDFFSHTSRQSLAHAHTRNYSKPADLKYNFGKL
jgi:hypothetical protein